MTQGCNAYHCNCPWCASYSRFNVTDIETESKNMAINHHFMPKLCPDLSPLLYKPEIFKNIELYQNFQHQIENNELKNSNGLKYILNDFDSFAHILMVDDRNFEKNDLVLDDDACNNFRKALIRNNEKIKSLKNDFFALLRSMKEQPRKSTFHFIRGLIIATIFQNFLTFDCFDKGFMFLLSIIMKLPERDKFVQALVKLPNICESFIFVTQSNLSTYIVMKSGNISLDNRNIKQIGHFLQLIYISNSYFPSSFYVNDLVSSYFNIEKENSLWKTGQFSFIMYKNVISIDKRLDFMILNKSYQYGTSYITVKRDNILSDALCLLKMSKEKLKNRIQVNFEGEEGIDFGGLLKEFIGLVAKNITAENNLLFSKVNDGYYWFTTYKYEDLNWYKLLGVVIALALTNKVMLPIHFPDLLYKNVIGQKLKIEDIAEIKPEVADSLQNLLSCDNVEEADLTFSVTSFVNGAYTDIDLIPNGSKIKVTQSNVEAYVNRMMNWIAYEEVKDGIDYFSAGFRMVIDFELGFWFKASELNLIISGINKFNWTEIEAAAIYEGYTSKSKTIVHFWKIFNCYSHQEKLKLMFFITGSESIPIEGVHQIKIKIMRTSAIDTLPTAHTCFATLVLPDFQNLERLSSALRICLENSEGFGFK